MPTKQKEDSNRCVLTLPLLTEPWQEHIIEKRFKIIEHLKNQLISIELRKLKNLQRTKAYKNLIKQIDLFQNRREQHYIRKEIKC